MRNSQCIMLRKQILLWEIYLEFCEAYIQIMNLVLAIPFILNSTIINYIL